MVSADERPELLGHSVDQLLLVSLIFPKLCKHVVLPAGVLHPEQRRKESNVCKKTAVEGELAGDRTAWCTLAATQS